jgi:hypothetical protein
LSNPIIVQSLIGKNQLGFYLKCLESLLIYCEEEIVIYLHTDGNISKKEEDFIFSHLPSEKVRFSNLKTNYEKTQDALTGHPNCQKFRKQSIWGLEFFDPLFANSNDPISFYLDADILILRPFSGLFDRAQTKGGAVFLKDTQWDAYCFRPWDLLGLGKKPEAVKGITTGLVFWDKQAIDWDYLEWFLGAPYLHKIQEWIMPTAQAGLASRCSSKTICPLQIPNLYPNTKISEDMFGVHLLGSYREEWIKKIQSKESKRKQNLKATVSRFQACEKQNILGYSIKQMRRWKNTRLNLW